MGDRLVSMSVGGKVGLFWMINWLWLVVRVVVWVGLVVCEFYMVLLCVMSVFMFVVCILNLIWMRNW